MNPLLLASTEVDLVGKWTADTSGRVHADATCQRIERLA
jgi:hypothetical protein